ncbi:MAG: roadblock/LC7 domain-containing protein [Wenzhouxiangellaceae bacterium]
MKQTDSHSSSRGQASQVRSELRSLMSASGDGINAAAAMTGDGLVIASILDPGVDADRFAAMSASLLALAERQIEEIERGSLVQLMIEGTRGAVLLVRAGTDAVLAVSTNPGAMMGRIFIDTRKAARQLESVLNA